MTPEQRALAALSPAYEGDLYNGANDLGIQFEGSASSFADEGKTGLTYNMTITNTDASAVDRSISLCPGYFSAAADIKDANGVAVDAIVAEGTIIGTANDGNRLIGKGSPKSITDFLGFLKYNPTRFTGLKMQVSNSDQFDKEIYIKQNSPFRNLQDRQITPNTYKDSNQQDDKRVEIPLEDYQMDNNTTVVTTIAAGRSVTYNWFVGAIKNSSYELQTKAIAARQSIGRKYGQY